MDRLPRYVKFTGVFRDLKSRGYRFWKAYASNYRVYTKRFNGQEYGDWCNVWQHLGGYVEVDGFMEWTYLLVEAVARGEHKTWVRKDSIFRDGVKLDSLTFYVNMKDNTMLVADENFPYIQRPNYHLMHRTVEIGADLDAEYDEYYRTWREITLKDYIIKEIEDLLADGIIAVVSDDRKY